MDKPGEVHGVQFESVNPFGELATEDNEEPLETERLPNGSEDDELPKLQALSTRAPKLRSKFQRSPHAIEDFRPSKNDNPYFFATAKWYKNHFLNWFML